VHLSAAWAELRFPNGLAGITLLTVNTESDSGAPQHRAAHQVVPSNSRRADIQGLRAVAVIAVVAFHAGLPIPGGFVGVDIFFVISGFVIARVLLGQLNSDSTIGFRAFYARRMRRLLPALALLTTVTALLSTVLLSPLGPQQAAAKTGIAASLFSANIQLERTGGTGYFGLLAETNPLLHTWSLSVEEQFYLVFPALLLVAWWIGSRSRRENWRGRSRRGVIGSVIVIVTACSFSLCVWMSFSPSSQLGSTFAFYSPMTRAWEFGAGALVAIAIPAVAVVSRRVSNLFGVFGLVMVVYACFGLTDNATFPGVAAGVPVIGTVLLLIAGMNPIGFTVAAFSVRPLVWIGDVSYGWYLWHWPFIVFATAMWPGNATIVIIVAIAAFIPTWISYRFVETPIRSSEQVVGCRLTALIVTCIATPIGACLVLGWVSSIERRSEAVAQYTYSARPHGEAKVGCQDLVPVAERPAGDCTWPVDNPHGSIYLIGDSNAAHFTEPAAKAANELGYDLTVASLPGCPFADLYRPADAAGFAGRGCFRFVTESVATLAQRKPSLVLIASSSSKWVNERGEFKDPVSGEIGDQPSSRARLWEDGIARVLQQFRAAGVPVVVIHAVPHLGAFGSEWERTICPPIRIFRNTCSRVTEPRSKIEQQQQPARDAENRAIEQAPGSSSVDFTDFLCSAYSCSSDRAELPVYLDGDHLSVDGALTLTDQFHELIAAQAAAR